MRGSVSGASDAGRPVVAEPGDTGFELEELISHFAEERERVLRDRRCDDSCPSPLFSASPRSSAARPSSFSSRALLRLPLCSSPLGRGPWIFCLRRSTSLKYCTYLPEAASALSGAGACLLLRLQDQDVPVLVLPHQVYLPVACLELPPLGGEPSLDETWVLGDQVDHLRFAP